MSNAKLLKGGKLAQKILQQLKKEILKQKVKPGLAVILIGKNPASKIYVKLKEKACQNIGIKFKKYLLPAKTSENKIISLIKEIDQNPRVHGLIIQLPLPKHLNPNRIIQFIAQEKDVDGFHEKSHFVSPTHQAILELLKSTGKNLKNKSALIVAKSRIFPQPLVKILKEKGIRIKIKILKMRGQKIKLKTDILIVILGWPKFVKPEMIKTGAIIIDAGYNRIKGRTVGDVDPACQKKASFLSPVPGGVGPLTVAFLLKNVWLSKK